jgi:hypothetical protein
VEAVSAHDEDTDNYHDHEEAVAFCFLCPYTSQDPLRCGYELTESSSVLNSSGAAYAHLTVWPYVMAGFAMEPVGTAAYDLPDDASLNAKLRSVRTCGHLCCFLRGQSFGTTSPSVATGPRRLEVQHFGALASSPSGHSRWQWPLPYQGHLWGLPA